MTKPNSNNDEKPIEMINDWKPEVGSFLNRLVAAGIKIISVDNGEDDEKFTTMEKAIKDAIACDEACIWVLPPDRTKPCWIYLVLGNDPGELPSDYVINPYIEKCADEHYKEWEGKAQPKCPSPY